MSMKDTFTKIYDTDYWVKGSGEGSYAEHTRAYQTFIEKFLKEKNIKSVVDLGCGDWQFSQFIKWGDAEYKGYDLVESVIEKNKDSFSKENISFNVLAENDFAALPSADLIIVKDVLQHWPTSNVQAFLPYLKKFKYALITNCIHPARKTNRDIEMGEFRPLDLGREPFNLRMTPQLKFSPQSFWKDLIKKKWVKRTDLYRSPE